MPKTPRVTPRKLIAALKKNGFIVDRQRGSHLVLRSLDGRQTVIPMHAQDIPIGTLRGILRDIDLTIVDLIEML